MFNTKQKMFRWFEDTWSIEKEQEYTIRQAHLPCVFTIMNRVMSVKFQPITLPSPLICVKFQPIRVTELTGVCTPVRDILTKELDGLQSMSLISTRGVSCILSTLMTNKPLSNHQLCNVCELFPALVRMVHNEFQKLQNEIDEWKDKYTTQTKLLSKANKKIIHLENEQESNCIAKLMKELNEQLADLQAKNHQKDLELLKMQDEMNKMELINQFELNKHVESSDVLFMKMQKDLKNKRLEFHHMNIKYQKIIIEQMTQINKQETRILSLVYASYTVLEENERRLEHILQQEQQLEKIKHNYEMVLKMIKKLKQENLLPQELIDLVFILKTIDDNDDETDDETDDDS